MKEGRRVYENNTHTRHLEVLNVPEVSGKASHESVEAIAAGPIHEENGPKRRGLRDLPPRNRH